MGDSFPHLFLMTIILDKLNDEKLVSTMEAETMQDIENYYPSITEVVDKSHI